MTNPTDLTPAVPAPGVNPLRTAADWRDLLHRIVTAVLVVFGTAQVAWADPKGLIVAVAVPAVLGIVDAAVSFANSNDGGRRLVYAVLGAGQAIVAGIGYAADSTPVLIVGLAAAVVNSVYASQFTATSPVSAAPAPGTE
ncbi:hypothetical protein ACQ856_18035 [Mycolicibacterium psychrotolerans]|uniref:hypothetical protein n=1 Tax=Mycolicibacterium psychrotolerans TaxID=216929 RepID=UPI003D675BB5